MCEHTLTVADKLLQQEADQPAALEQFLSDASERAFHVAYGALWDRETALDVVQESMLKLVEYYSGKPPAQWPALFRTVLNSKINDERRRRMLTQGKYRLLSLTGFGSPADDAARAQVEADLPARQASDGTSAPEAELQDRLLGERIHTAMQTLPARQRQVFLLRERQGLSIRETATTLGCSENAVKQHHFRALRALREQLAEVWADERSDQTS